MDENWLDAQTAQAKLGVRAQTLYAYVSRGLLRARADPDDPRRGLYSASDIDALNARKRRGRKTSEIAAGAMAWGEPALVSAISTVSGNRLFYRGRDAVGLAETETFEHVAALLRGGDAIKARASRPGPPAGKDPLARAFLALAARAGSDAPLAGRQTHALAEEAATLLETLCDAIAGSRGTGAIPDRLARAWGHEAGGEASDLIRRALVLLADHELNPSAFAARVAASTGASLAAAALAGLAALSGPRHGGSPAALALLLARAADRGPRAAIAERLADLGALPGFGHPLYRERDPRAEALLSRLSLSLPLRELSGEVKDFAGLFPNVDFALVALADALRLPEGAPIAIFAIARCAGWIAQAIEQAQSAVLIRPRAKYVGVAVE